MGSGERKVERPPVLLVPGWFQGAGRLRPVEGRFRKAGWPDGAVQRAGFRDRVGSNVDHGRELASVLDDLFERSGGKRVAVVAHSMGGLAVRQALRDPGTRDKVLAAVFLATPHGGTWAAYLGWGGGAKEMRPGSPFLEALGADPWPEEIPTIDLWTPWETHILPNRSTRRPGVRAVRIPTALHFTLPYSRRAFDEVVRFIEEVME